MFDKKGVVSFTTFSLIVILMVLVFVFAYSYYDSSKTGVDVLVAQEEALNSITSFRGELINLMAHNNTNLTYNNVYGLEDIKIILDNKTISGEIYTSQELVIVNISSLGIKFCSNYTLLPTLDTTLNNNGSCISVTN